MFELGTAAASLYNNSLNDDFANITDFSLSADKLQLYKGSTYITKLASESNCIGTGIYIDTNSSGLVDSGDELIAILSNHKNLVSMSQIKQVLV